MIDGLLASILSRHGAELSAACREELAAAMESLASAPSVRLESVTATVDFADENTSQQTWTGLEEQTTASRSLLPARYEDLGLLGYGGMGQVRRVKDRRLGREVALKLVRVDAKPEDLARFAREAEITAGLQHPGVVPIYDFGSLENGSPFYTMPVIGGRHLGQAIARVHQASGPDGFGTAWDGMGLRKLVIALLSAAEAVAYAHSHGAIHRDLKPDNIMLGEFGETLVVDWGLAQPAEETGHTGKVSGTPAYMAPEQARGEPESLRTDVYGLGAVLYEVLTGRPPFRGDNAKQVIQTVAAAPPPPVERVAAVALPDELVDLCTWSMQREMRERPASAREVAAAASSWLDGARRREQAELLVAQSEALFHEVTEARLLASERDGLRDRLAASVGPHGSMDDKREVWRLEDEVSSLRRRAALDEQRGLQALRSALIQVPELAAARRKLASYYRARHGEAERERAFTEAGAMELLLREHDRGEHARYLSGVGAVSLRTDPAGASVEVLRYEERDRRLQLISTGRVHRTPLEAMELPIGSYLLRIRAHGRETVRYPVTIGREEHWDGVDPDGDPVAISLPRAGRLGDGVYVPAGWCTVGGDPKAPEGVARARVWCEPFVVDRHHVTNAQYIAFLDALAGDGRRAEALALAPRERGEHGELIYGHRDDGFVLQADADGDLWLPDWPVLMVSLRGALSYARWRRDADGLPWRLPGELEWEKAARGVDGRFFPWGDHIDATFANGRDTRIEEASPCPVTECRADESVYGMTHAAGNAFEWCAEPYDGQISCGSGERYRVSAEWSPAGQWTARGGDWYCVPRQWRLARRIRLLDPDYRSGGLSFRLARPLVPSEDC